jgi:hypothetical protein
MIVIVIKNGIKVSVENSGITRYWCSSE